MGWKSAYWSDRLLKVKRNPLYCISCMCLKPCGYVVSIVQSGTPCDMDRSLLMLSRCSSVMDLAQWGFRELWCSHEMTKAAGLEPFRSGSDFPVWESGRFRALPSSVDIGCSSWTNWLIQCLFKHASDLGTIWMYFLMCTAYNL